MSGTQYAPTQAGFDAWIYSTLGCTTEDLPADSPFLVYAYNVAIEVVNMQLQVVSPLIYMLAVYNLAADNLINYAPNTGTSTFFTDTGSTISVLM